MTEADWHGVFEIREISEVGFPNSLSVLPFSIFFTNPHESIIMGNYDDSVFGNSHVALNHIDFVLIAGHEALEGVFRAVERSTTMSDQERWTFSVNVFLLFEFANEVLRKHTHLQLGLLIMNKLRIAKEKVAHSVPYKYHTGGFILKIVQEYDIAEQHLVIDVFRVVHAHL